MPPRDIKPPLAYAMLFIIVGGVALACVKDGATSIDINMTAFLWASLANLAAALKGKVGKDVTGALKKDSSKNMDAANVYAVMNILSFLWTCPAVVVAELPTLREEWEHSVSIHGAGPLIFNITMSGFFFYIYNEFAFAFTSQVGAVTSSVLNTAKRVIIIVVSAIMFNEGMGRNKMIGSGIAIAGTFLYSMASKKSAPKAKKA